MQWLKGLKISVKVAIGALLMAMAVMAAKRAKDNADKWRNNAVEIENGYVIKGVETAAAANTQAKIHDNKAHEINKKAKAYAEKMGGQNESVSSILDQFRAS